MKSSTKSDLQQHKYSRIKILKCLQKLYIGPTNYIIMKWNSMFTDPSKDFNKDLN